MAQVVGGKDKYRAVCRGCHNQAINKNVTLHRRQSIGVVRSVLHPASYPGTLPRCGHPCVPPRPHPTRGNMGQTLSQVDTEPYGVRYFLKRILIYSVL